MKHSFRFVAIVLLGVMLLSACSTATEEPANALEAIEMKGSIVCGTSADLPPFEFVDDDGEFTGFDLDFIREVGSRMGVEVEIQDMAFDSIIANVQGGKIDCAIAKITGTAKRDEQVDFSDPYFASNAAVLARKDSNIQLADVFDFPNYILGTQAGNVPTDWITENLLDTGLMDPENFLNFERAEQGYLDLLAGRIDIWVGAINPGLEIISKEPDLEIVLETSVWSRPAVILVAEGEKELRDKLSDIINEMIADGSWEDLLNEYEIPVPLLPLGQ